MGVGARGMGVVRLWWASCTAAIPSAARLEALLDDSERRRLDRIRATAGRRQFMAAHALARLVLSRTTGVPPAALRLAYGPRGKPVLAGDNPPSAPRFNLAHSGDTVVVALASSEVGADVESLRPLPARERLLRRFCSDAERRWIDSMPEDDRDRCFLALWTFKEAYLKAVGAGIAMALREVEIDPRGPRLARIAGDEGPAAGWSLLATELPEPAVASVAIRGRGWTLEVLRFDWETDRAAGSPHGGNGNDSELN